MMSGRNSFPFTAIQWQELEHQALIFKYMVAGMPIPADLLFTIKRSLDSSLSSNLILHQPQQIGWNCYQMGFGRKIDPEPGRCRRTDGKKWRCSKEAYPDSKYCERHMHRGRNRSRKPVDNTNTMTTSTNSSSSTITKNPNPSSSSSYSLSSMASDTHHSHHSQPSYTSNALHVLNPHSFFNPHSSTRPQDNTTHLLLDPAPNYSHKDYRTNRYGHGVKEEVDIEHVFFSETSHGQTMRSSSGSSIDDSWQLTMGGGGSSLTHLEQRTCSGLESTAGYSYSQQLQGLTDDTSKHQKQDHHCFAFGTDAPLKIERDEEPRKVMHHFFDESPPRNKDSWLDSKDRSSNHKPVSETQLSISIPNYSHDFFTTHNRNGIN